METSKISWEYQLKAEKDKLTKKEKELEKLKTERTKWETKAQAVEDELSVSFFSSSCFKSNFISCFSGRQEVVRKSQANVWKRNRDAQREVNA